MKKKLVFNFNFICFDIPNSPLPKNVTVKIESNFPSFLDLMLSQNQRKLDEFFESDI